MADFNAKKAPPQGGFKPPMGRPGGMGHGGPMGPGRPGGPGPGGPPALRGGEKARDFGGTVAKLLKYISKYKLLMVLVMFISLLSSIFGIIGPKLMGKATDVLYKAVENGFIREKANLNNLKNSWTNTIKLEQNFLSS